MINTIPIFGWIISAILNISLAVPFWICWTNLQIGAKYFDFLPAKYQAIPFWDVVGIFIVISILKVLLPRLVSISNDSKSESKPK